MNICKGFKYWKAVFHKILVMTKNLEKYN